MPKTIYRSQKGYVSCPSCLSHIRLEDDVNETVCPFCEENLTIAIKAPEEGGKVLDVLRNSRSGFLAGALAGAGLTLTVACTEPDPNDDNEDPNSWEVSEDSGDDTDDGGEVNVEPNYEDHNITADYGDFSNYENSDDYNQDPGQDAGTEDAEG